MKTCRLWINDVEFEVKRPSKRTAHKELKAFVVESGHDWVDSKIFLASFPKKGRALVKRVGYKNLYAVW